MIIYGINPVLEALKAGRVVRVKSRPKARRPPAAGADTGGVAARAG